MKNRLLIALLLSVVALGAVSVSYIFDLLNTPSDMAVLVGWLCLCGLFIILPTVISIIFKRIVNNWKVSKENKP